MVRTAPEPTPNFGWTPQRNIEREYREMRRQWLDVKETIEQGFNERIEKCQTAQDDLRFAFDAANDIQAQKDRESYEQLMQTQDRTRWSAIEREQSRMEQSVTREFEQNSREAAPERGL